MSDLRRRYLMNTGASPDPYASLTYGYGINRNGRLYANANLCTTDYIELPVLYTNPFIITFYCGPYVANTQSLGDMSLVFYDENKELITFMNYSSRYMTLELSRTDVRYIRCCFYVPYLDLCFIRLTNEDSTFSYLNMFTGKQYPAIYDTILFGYYETNNGMNKNVNKSCCIGYYDSMVLPTNCSTVRMDINGGVISSYTGALILLGTDNGFLVYFSQNAGPRTMEDSRFGTTWPRCRKNSYSKNLDTTYVLDVTNNNYLFKGLDVP